MCKKVERNYAIVLTLVTSGWQGYESLLFALYFSASFSIVAITLRIQKVILSQIMTLQRLSIKKIAVKSWGLFKREYQKQAFYSWYNYFSK